MHKEWTAHLHSEIDPLKPIQHGRLLFGENTTPHLQDLVNSTQIPPSSTHAPRWLAK